MKTVEHKLKISKREIKHIIGKLTYINNFVFADPFLPFGTIWKAYAHYTHSEEKSARVRFCLPTKKTTDYV
ncbi:MAG: hypothetical protein JEY97_04245 [Bacteroidales bacterium]|nr:hypothetical protein [Bacteroidales bacterium]